MGRIKCEGWPTVRSSSSLSKLIRERSSASILGLMASSHETRTQTLAAFKFQKLRFADSIRILNLKHGASADPIHATLTEHRLSKLPQFECVSYTWGKPVFSETIYVDKIPFKITENLHSALLRLRKPKESRHAKGFIKDGIRSLWRSGKRRQNRALWIDAICINQNNDDEKAIQVWMMGRIFSQATRVLVWLGEGTEETDCAMRSLDEIVDIASASGFVRTGDMSLTLHSKCPSAVCKDIITTAEMNSFSSIGSLPWFSRLWVIQEVMLAQHCLVICGAFSADWTQFCSCARILIRAHQISGFVYGKGLMSALRSVSMIVKSYRSFKKIAVGPPRDLELQKTQLLYALKHQQCTDDRDRVYAVLALFSRIRNARVEVMPDYALTTAQVYKGFTQEGLIGMSIAPANDFLLRSVGLFQHLEPYIPISLNDLNNEHLPSWSLDLRVQWLRVLNMEQYRSIFFDKNKSHKPSRFECTFDQSGNVLGVTAQQCDTISYILPATEKKPNNNFHVRRIVSSLEECLSKTNSATDEPWEIELACTLVAQGCNNVFWKLFGKKVDLEAFTSLWKLFKHYCLDEDNTSTAFTTDGSSQAMTHSSTDALQAYKYRECVCRVLRSAIIFVTARGYLGLAPKASRTMIGSNTIVCLISGFPTPFLLLPWKPRDNPGLEEHYSLIGPAYVYKIINGEFERQHGSKQPWKKISII